MASQHIPAWKKLGLKLKNASDAAHETDVVSAAPPVSAEKKRKFADQSSGNIQDHQLGSVDDRAHSELSKSEEKKHKRRRLTSEKDASESNEQATEGKSDHRSTLTGGQSVVKTLQATQLSEPNGLKDSTSYKERTKMSRSSKHSRPDKAKEPISENSKAEILASEEDRSDPATTDDQTGTAPAVKRRKSVTFTPETKKDDGDSAQKLFKEWTQEQRDANAEFTSDQVAEFLTPPSTHPANHEPSTTTGTPSKKDKKQAKKARREADAEVPAKSGAPLPYVTYLQQYHTARDGWKFNKSRQVDLLKNIFNIYRIPPDLDEALKAYIAGLKGAAARQRLREGAQALLKELDEARPPDDQANSTGPEGGEEKTMDDPAARAEAREAALRTQLKKTKQRMRDEDNAAYEQSPEFRQLRAKRRRAEYVLAALAASEAQISDVPSSNVNGNPNGRGNGQANGVTSGPKQATHIRFDDDEHDASDVAGGTQERGKRKHSWKKRTGVPDDDELSSVSSVESIPSPAGSEDESSSEEEDDESEEESSSSSGSSSSSSGSSSSSSSSDPSDED